MYRLTLLLELITQLTYFHTVCLFQSLRVSSRDSVYLEMAEEGESQRERHPDSWRMFIRELEGRR